MKTGDVGGMYGLVVPGVFDGGSDDGAAGGRIGGAGDDIDLRCADDEMEWKRARQGDGEHLSLTRGDAKVWQKISGEGPGACAVDEALRGKDFGCGVDFDL